MLALRAGSRPRHPHKSLRALPLPRRPPEPAPPVRGDLRLTRVTRLAPYRDEHGPAIVGWLTSIDEADAWAAQDRLPVVGDLARWHADPDIHPFVWLDGDQLVGYGEIWEDREEDEAELARLVVAPGHRGRGHGRALTRALADEAHHRGFEAVWLRVVEENGAARRAYEAAAFERATPEQEAAFNVGQPRAYVWMRDVT